MAVDKIIHNAPEMFSLTAGSGLSGGGKGIYFPSTGIVLLSFDISSSSDIGTSTTLVTIPEKYRPSQHVNANGSINGANNYTYATPSIDINTNGTIKQGASSVARRVSSCAIYLK